MLALPWAIEAMGLGLGVFMLVLSGLGAYWGLYLLTDEGKYTKVGNASFYNIAQVVRPSTSIFFFQFSNITSALTLNCS